MANCWLYSPVIFLSLSIHTMAFNRRHLKAVPSSARTVGVFMIPEDGQYVFNFTAARAACLWLNATMATEEQMDMALQHGLQTCKFGWIEGPVAVVPRNTSDPKCGTGKVGLVSWKAKADKTFGAFCFKVEDVHTTTAIPVTFKPMTKVTRRRHPVRTTVAPQVARVPPARSPPPTKPPRKTRPSLPRARVVPLKPTQRTSWYPSSSSSSSSSSSPSSSRIKPSPSTSAPPPAMTSPTTRRKLKARTAVPVGASSLSSFPLHPSTSTTTTSTTTSTTTTTTSTTEKSPTDLVLYSTKASMGALPVALIVVGLILLLGLAVAVAWYCRLRYLFPPPWSRGQWPVNQGETEMWRQTDDEADPRGRQASEDQADGKKASEVTLCIDPETKADAVA